jgi:hypothetical protein
VFEMTALIQIPIKCEMIAVIRFLIAKGECPAEIHKQIVAVYGDVMNQQTVTKWCRELSEGRTDVHDEQKSSSKPSLISDDLLQKIEGEICANQCGTIRELHHIIPKVSKTTIYEAVTQKLGYRKLCACWVPKMLTDDHKMKWMGSALKFLTCYAQERDELLDSIVTGDETCVFHHTAELKQKFDDNDEVQEEVMTWFKGQVADFYDLGIQKLLPRLNKCLDNASDYFKK